MDVTKWAAAAFAIVVLGVIAFQLALAAGVPWGSYAMGGAFPGRFPPRMRLAALIQAGVLLVSVGIVLSRARLLLPRRDVAPWLIWPVVALALVALVLNAISPSAGERRIWVPVALAMLLSSLVVALTAG
jgi:hypothetical protein